MGVLSGLRPEKVFYYFEKLCQVPRGSGNTRRVSDLCVAFARELGLRYRQDEAGNVIVWKDASPGYEGAAPVMLQGHMDMVCVKTEDCAKDMAQEGLDLATDGEYVWAEKTSLGGDDGIAVAIALAVLADDALPHPPLEAVFTVDEETTMNGAAALDCSDLKARKLLNLDAEREGVFTVSCAGGMRANALLGAQWGPLRGESVYAVEITGLLGGHSGVEIDKGRASANVLMGRVLYTALQRIPGLRVAALRGGRFDNVICSDCRAVAAVSAGGAAAFEACIRELDGVLKDEYAAAEPGVTVRCAPAQADSAVSAADSERLLRTLFILPQGVQEMSMDLKGHVQTSLNLGVMALEDDGLHLTYAIRSSINSQKELLLQKVEAAVAAAGGSVSARGRYPSWRYEKNSPLRDAVMAAYKDISGADGVIEATHGGLECGMFIEKMAGLDAVAMGPTMHDIHSVNERLHVASTERLYRLVCEVLKRSR